MKKTLIHSQYAGAGMVQPQPPRSSSLIEESRPLQIFIQSLPAMQSAFSQIGVPFFAANALNALPKIALGKWEIEQHDGFLKIISGGEAVLFPTSDLQAWYAGVLGSLETGVTVRLIPEFIATALKTHHRVSKHHDEYIMRTESVQTFPGGRNAALRGNVNKARRLCEIEEYDPIHLEDYKRIVRLWYRQNASLKFRTYDKTSIDWLLDNWEALKEHVPDIICLGVRYEGELISLNMGCKLSNNYWCAYTQRFDRNAPVKHANMLGYNELAARFNSIEFENDGTADTASIRAWKDRLVQAKTPFFKISPKV